MLKPGLVRFLLALMVVLFHISRYMFLGRFAVCSFFILSGYWITAMFTHKYSKKSHPLKVFYISRIWRLFPVFYVFIAIAFGIGFLMGLPLIASINALPLNDKIVFFVSHTLLLTFYSFPHFNMLVPAWSLDIELQFYLLFPLLFKLLQHNAKYLLITCIALCLPAFYILQQYPNPWVSNSLIVFFQFFIAGMLIYHYRLKFTQKTELVATGLLVMVIIAQYIIPYAAQHYKDVTSLYYQLLSFILTILFIPAISNSVRRQSDKTDRLLGNLSFLIYFSHWVILKPFILLIDGKNGISRIMYTPVYLVAVVLLAFIVYKLVDRPLEKLRHKWINNQP